MNILEFQFFLFESLFFFSVTNIKRYFSKNYYFLNLESIIATIIQAKYFNRIIIDRCLNDSKFRFIYCILLAFSNPIEVFAFLYQFLIYILFLNQ